MDLSLDFLHTEDISLSLLPWVAVVGSLIGYYVVRCFYLLYWHPLSRFPGPRWASLSTNWIIRLKNTGFAEEELERMHKSYGSRAIRIGPNHLHLTDPSLYKTIYAQNGTFTKDTSFYGAFGIPHTLFVEDNISLHRAKRRILNPFFSRSSVVSLHPDILQVLEKIKQRLESTPNKPVNLYGLARSLTTDIITKYAYGRSVGVLESCDESFTPKSNVITAFDAMMRVLYNRGYQPTTRRIQDLLPTRLVVKLSSDVRAILKLREEAAKNLRIYENNSKRPEHPVIFDALKDCSHADQVAESVSIVAGGSDTTAFTLTYACYEICRNPCVKERLVQEVDGIYRNSSSTYPSLAELETGHYLSAVVKESLRLALAVPAHLPRIVPRKLPSPLQVDGMTIPPGTSVGISAYTMHRDEAFWGENATEFNPDRWLQPDSKVLMNNFVTFSKGDRNCAGQTLAYAELHIALAYLVREFNISLVEDTGEFEAWDCFARRLNSPVMAAFECRS